MCYGAEEAGEEILAYLTEPGRMPKKACINAPWIAGMCDGINLRSRMFHREECQECKYFNPAREERTMNETLADVMVELKGITADIRRKIIYLSCGKGLCNDSLEETLESINENLAFLVKEQQLTVEQSAAVLTVAMKACEVGKKERTKA